MPYAIYPRSEFADRVDTVPLMSDLEPSDLALIAEYYKLFNSGNLNAAKELIRNNMQLDSKLMNAEKYNRLRDCLLAIQQYYFDNLVNTNLVIWY